MTEVAEAVFHLGCFEFSAPAGQSLIVSRFWFME